MEQLLMSLISLTWIIACLNSMDCQENSLQVLNFFQATEVIFFCRLMNSKWETWRNVSGPEKWSKWTSCWCTRIYSANLILCFKLSECFWACVVVVEFEILYRKMQWLKKLPQNMHDGLVTVAIDTGFFFYLLFSGIWQHKYNPRFPFML